MIDEFGHEQHDNEAVRLMDNFTFKLADDCRRAGIDCSVRGTEWVSFLPNNWTIHEARHPGIVGYDITNGTFISFETLAQ